MKRLILAALVAVSLAAAVNLCGCSGCEQMGSHIGSFTTGLNRVITLYNCNGEVIKEWRGRYNVETEAGVARFMNKGKAVTISGTFTVIEY